MLARLKAWYRKHGKIAIGVYVLITALTWAVLLVAFSAAGKASAIGAAWIGSRITQPFRIAATAALTPYLARLLRRRGHLARAGTS